MDIFQSNYSKKMTLGLASIVLNMIKLFSDCPSKRKKEFNFLDKV